MTAAEIAAALEGGNNMMGGGLDPLRYALLLGELGIACFFCHWNKVPACPHGYKDATRDPTGLHNLWNRCPGELVAVVTGEASNLDVLDIDSGKHPEAGRW